MNPHTLNLPFLAYQYKPMGLSQGFKIIEEITTITENVALEYHAAMTSCNTWQKWPLLISKKNLEINNVHMHKQ